MLLNFKSEFKAKGNVWLLTKFNCWKLVPNIKPIFFPRTRKLIPPFCVNTCELNTLESVESNKEYESDAALKELFLLSEIVFDKEV